MVRIAHLDAERDDLDARLARAAGGHADDTILDRIPRPYTLPSAGCVPQSKDTAADSPST